MKKVLVLNLPYSERITRRYMCSYVSPESLFPPLELIAVGGVAREWKGAEVQLIDAIADEIDHAETVKRISVFDPDVIITITGLEVIENDVAEISQYKTEFPNATMIAFGHYCTQFPKEILESSDADYIILGEPDLIFSELYDAIMGDKDLKEVNGICYTNESGEYTAQGRDMRIPNPDVLPMPAYDLLPEDKYFEPMMERPFAMIQSARGCPYQCNYCVKSFGTKLGVQSADRVIEEIKFLKERFGIKSLRFIDDTFTIQKKRVLDLCKKMVEEELDIEWACLSRTDNLPDEILYWMKKAGCKRIYFGLESGSQKVLDSWKKNVNVEEAIESLLLCRKHGIETTGFFISGYSEETEEDFQQTIDFARKAKLTYASINPLTLYPGTGLFDRMKDDIDFSILPYKNEWKDKSIEKVFTQRKKEFYKKFYMRPGYVFSNFSNITSNVGEIGSHAKSMLSYLFMGGKFTISGLKGPQDK